MTLRKKRVPVRCLGIGLAALLLWQSAPMQVPVESAYAEAEQVCAVYLDEGERLISGGLYTMMVRLSGKLITAAADGNLHQWENCSDTSQQWRIFQTGGGYCKLLSATDLSLAMTVENGNAENGNNIYLSPDIGSEAQQFMLHRTDDAYYITARCSGNAALDVYDISYDNGANIDQWDYWGGEGQKFYLRPVDNCFSPLRGDMNGDGVLNAADLTRQKRGFLCGFNDAAECIADIDGDGTLTGDDIHLLADAIHGKQETTLSNCDIPYETAPTAYLFAYFLGNAPEQERLSYAVSTDGYHFNALNEGAAVWQTSVGTGCLRDPYVFKGEDGLYYLLATDMKSSLGWNSNRNLISAKSTDLIHWFDETCIEIANKYPLMQGADRAWAPQAIYDPIKQSYMIYWAARVPGRDDRTVMYYAYSNDMKTLDTEPQLLFAPVSGDDAIDSDIIYQNGTYYMYYKNETNKRLYLATADSTSGPYKEKGQISEGNTAVEGPNIYNIIGTEKWVMMSDAYTSGKYILQETTDLQTFSSVPGGAYSFDFTPRHGYVIPITADQYGALTSAYPSAAIVPRSIGVTPVSAQLRTGETLRLPETVQARYSDGGEQSFPISWDASDIAAVDTTRPGSYTVTGRVQVPDYENPLIPERADPYIVDGSDGWYYFTASYPAFGSVDKGYDRIILRRSMTVAGLATAEEKTIWQAHPSGSLAKHIWAPELHCINGCWYVFFAAGNSDDVWHIRPYVLKCTGNPYTGTWTECGQMRAAPGDDSPFQSFSLDMTYFTHGGKHYVIWAEIKGDSSLFMAEIDPDTPYQLTSAPILLTKPEYDWELVNNRVNEGASVLKTNSKVYVFFSASGTGSEYCMGRLEADINADLMNTASWKKLKRPVLTTAGVPGEAGPGHNCFVTDENGNLLLVYHARPASHSEGACGSYNNNSLYDPCRHARVRGVYFGADGAPVIGLSGEQLLAAELRTVTAIVTVR